MLTDPIAGSSLHKKSICLETNFSCFQSGQLLGRDHCIHIWINNFFFVFNKYSHLFYFRESSTAFISQKRVSEVSCLHENRLHEDITPQYQRIQFCFAFFWVTACLLHYYLLKKKEERIVFFTCIYLSL